MNVRHTLRKGYRSGCLSLLFVWLFTSCSHVENGSQQVAVPVVTALAVSRTIPYQITSIGTAEAFLTVSVRPQVGGVINRVYFEEGQQVGKGDPLFLIDPAPYKTALEAASAKLERDQITAGNMEENLKRYDELVKKEYITPQQYNDMVSELEAMRATIRADEADVENARLNLEYCSIKAPINGRMGVCLVDAGNVVKKEGDEPLVVINQLQPILVRFTVPEEYLSELLQYSASRTLEVRVHSPGEQQGIHKGRLTFIDNAVDASTGTILLKAEFTNDDLMLWPGEFLNVVLVLKQLEDAVIVPSQAIGTGQMGDFLFVVKPDSTVELRQITVSYRLDNDAVIESGIQPGEKVVIDGQLRLRPGSKTQEKSALAPDTESAS